MKPQLCQTSLLCSSICSGVNAFCFDATSVSTSTCWTTTAAISNTMTLAINLIHVIQISEIRDFAGEEIEVKKLVDANSKEAVEKAKAPSAVDSVLEQIKKKPKLSVLDKTKKDWGEFKEENKGLEDELDAYKKSSNQYLDKVSFLQRTDYREFERERDVRLASQSKRRPDLQEEP